jgi:hypothetical protein
MSGTLYADAKTKIETMYKKGQYKRACQYGLNQFSTNQNDENFVMYYGFACLESDLIDRLHVPITKLRYTPDGRKNAVYFSLILMQKKMLYHAMVDKEDISWFGDRSTDYVLSRVFNYYIDHIQKNPAEQKKDSFVFVDTKDSSMKYKLYVKKENFVSKIYLEEFKDGHLIKKHIYW